jgi:dsDNA-binding SOS-regulon protein
MLLPHHPDVETLAQTFHHLLQEEAQRQGEDRYPEAYDRLSEDAKEFDRVLARYVLQLVQEEKEAACLAEQQRVVHLVEVLKIRGSSADSRSAEEVTAHNWLLTLVVNRIVNL